MLYRQALSLDLVIRVGYAFGMEPDREEEYKKLLESLRNQMTLGLAGCSINWERAMQTVNLAYQYNIYLKQKVETEEPPA